MTARMWAACLGYPVLCLLWAAWAARRAGSVQKGLFCLVAGLALPGAGLLLVWLCDRLAREDDGPAYRELYRGESFCPEDPAALQPPDVRAETDHVPMEEALQLSDREYRRRVVMRLLDVEDPLVYLPALRRALSNEDGETSHYASVAILELRRKVQRQLDEAAARWRKAPRDDRVCAQWEELMYRVLDCDLYDADDRRRLLGRYCALSDRMLRAPRPSENCLHHRIALELEQGRHARAQRLCTRYLDLYPASEAAVRDQLAVCVHSKNGDGMKSFLSGLRSRPVLLTAQTLAWVRAFRKEGSGEHRPQ